MNVAKRLAKLEKTAAPIRANRFVVRFEGPGSERMPQPTEEQIEDAVRVFTVRFVAAIDGRPA